MTAADQVTPNLDGLGCVAIGRNEGERLERCLRALLRHARHVVYVDSGSTDGSVAFARSVGARVVELDRGVPFTAARARNEGWRDLAAAVPGLSYVQFVDGDCEVVDDWLPAAYARLAQDPALAVVCGRRRERFPERSVYNRLCDVEWDTPPGPADACGGDAMMRLAALQQVGGYRDDVIAGEEPELCLRLRLAGHKIERLDRDMTWHDANLVRFSQWWKRAVRAGHAFSEGAHMHGPSTGHYVRERRRAWVWGAVVPAVAIGGALPTLGLSLGLLAGYPVSAARVYRHVRRRRSATDAAASAVFVTLGKFAELQGAARFELGRLSGRRSRIIEYK